MPTWFRLEQLSFCYEVGVWENRYRISSHDKGRSGSLDVQLVGLQRGLVQAQLLLRLRQRPLRVELCKAALQHVLHLHHQPAVTPPTHQNGEAVRVGRRAM